MDKYYQQNDNDAGNLTTLFDKVFSNKIRLHAFLRGAGVAQETHKFLFEYIFGNKNLDALEVFQIRSFMKNFLQTFSPNIKQIANIPDLRFFLELSGDIDEAIEDELKGYVFSKFENKFQGAFFMEEQLIKKIIDDILG